MSKENACYVTIAKINQNLSNLVNSSGTSIQMHTEQRMTLQSNNIALLKNGKHVFCD